MPLRSKGNILSIVIFHPKTILTGILVTHSWDDLPCEHRQMSSNVQRCITCISYITYTDMSASFIIAKDTCMICHSLYVYLCMTFSIMWNLFHIPFVILPQFKGSLAGGVSIRGGGLHFHGGGLHGEGWARPPHQKLWDMVNKWVKRILLESTSFLVTHVCQTGFCSRG